MPVLHDTRNSLAVDDLRQKLSPGFEQTKTDCEMFGSGCAMSLSVPLARYFSESDDTSDRIMRCNLDGSNLEEKPLDALDKIHLPNVPVE